MTGLFRYWRTASARAGPELLDPAQDRPPADVNASICEDASDAFGCGAFRNPAHRIAQFYREEIMARKANFAVVAFAVFSAGYGPDNFTPFAEAMRCGGFG